MPRKDPFKRAMEQYLEAVKRTRAESTHKAYRQTLSRLYRIVKREGITPNLARWSVTEFSQLMSNRGHLLPNSHNQETVVMRNLLMFVGNMTIELAYKERALRRKPPSRVNVRWYSEEQLAYIRAKCRRDIEYLTLILGSEIGLRRSEIAALRLSDIQGDVMIIRGKGELYIPIPITRSLRDTLDAWLLIRRDMIRKALRRHPTATIPENILIHVKGTNIHPYSPETITDLMYRLGKRIGLKLSPHDLRRSCGREIYKATGDLLAVNRLLRHANLDQTRKYIGADMEDARRAMEARESKRTQNVPLAHLPGKNQTY